MKELITDYNFGKEAMDSVTHMEVKSDYIQTKMEMVGMLVQMVAMK